MTNDNRGPRQPPARRPPLPRQTILRLLVGGAIVAAAAVASLLSGQADPGAAPPSPTQAAWLPFPPSDRVGWEDVRWMEVQADAVLGGPLGQRIDRVVAGGPGFIAVGADAHGQPGSETSFGAIWVSATGENWAEAELTAGLRQGDSASIAAIASGPRGTVLLGSVCCGEERAAAWFSEEGTTWERVPLPVDAAETYVTDVAAGPDGFVGVGTAGGRMAVWTSSDGREWVTVDAQQAGLRPGSLTAVVRDREGWLAVGQFDDRPTHDGAVFRSPDLASWRKVADAPPLSGPDEVELWDVIAFEGGYLLVGSLGTHEDRVRCEQLLGRGGKLAAAVETALSCGWGARTHWGSLDGETWVLLPPVADQPGGAPLPVGPDGRRIMDFGPIRAAGPGVVTIGYDVAGRKGPIDVRALWTAADGRSWVPVGRAPQFPAGASVNDFVVVGRAVLAVGSWWTPEGVNGEDGRAWIGTILP